jgi:hypothetical protein
MDFIIICALRSVDAVFGAIAVWEFAPGKGEADDAR